jgi:hypothetical protein
MCDYESCNKNALLLKQNLPSSDVFNISISKKEGCLALLSIEFVIYQDVFYPITETVKLVLNNDKSYTLDSPISKDISLKTLENVITLLTA